jgi:ABC-type antimicrobial peptide transport system permease subunit
MMLGSIEGEGLPPEGLFPETNVVSPGFASVLGLALRGRDFDNGDRAETTPVAIINRSLSRQLFGETDPIGRTFSYGDGDDRRPLTVVGVIEDSQTSRIGEEQRGYLLLPLAQYSMNGLNVLLRSSLAPAAAASALSGAIARIDPNLPPPRVFKLSEQAAIALLPQRLASAVIGVLSGVGLLLVALGLYGLLSQFVLMRLREFGVRQALGADSTRIRREVRWRGLRLVVVGVLLALPLSFGVLQLCASVFVGVRTVDLPLVGTAALVLLAIAALSCLAPARRAAQISPAAALRSQ